MLLIIIIYYMFIITLFDGKGNVKYTVIYKFMGRVVFERNALAY